jgi:hypothetical protein
MLKKPYINTHLAIKGMPLGETIEPFSQFGMESATLAPKMFAYDDSPATIRHEQQHYIQMQDKRTPKLKGGISDYIAEMLPVNKNKRAYLEQEAESYEGY